MDGRRFGGALAIASALGVAFGCNAILGIDEPKLVDDTGSGGSGSGGSGSGGSGSGGEDESGGTDGGGNTTGSGGKGGGTGGKASGGAASSGGDTSSGGAATGGAPEGGSKAPSGVPNQVACGTESCRISSGSACCVETASGEPHCATSCDSASQSRFTCDGAEDCNAGAPICCFAIGSTTAQCAGTCTGRVFCGSDADCAPGQYCTPGTGALAVVSVCTTAPMKDIVWCGETPCSKEDGKACCYDKTSETVSCSATCGSNSIRYTCDDPTDCATGTVCCETRTGLGVITGSACQANCAPSIPPLGCTGPAGCGNGQLCCHLPTGGTQCAAQCPALASPLCGNDADCPLGECTLETNTEASAATGRTVCVAPNP